MWHTLPWLDAGEHESSGLLSLPASSQSPLNLGPYAPCEELPWGTLQCHSPLCSHSSIPQIGLASVPPWQSQVGPCCLTPWQRPPLLGRGPQPCPTWETTPLHCLWGHRPGCCPQRAAPWPCTQSLH